MSFSNINGKPYDFSNLCPALRVISGFDNPHDLTDWTGVAAYGPFSSISVTNSGSHDGAIA